MRRMSHSSSRIETRIPGAKAFWGEVIKAAMNGGIQKIRRARVKVISLETLAVPKTRPYGTVAHFGMRPCSRALRLRIIGKQAMKRRRRISMAKCWGCAAKIIRPIYQGGWDKCGGYRARKAKKIS